VLAQNNFNKAKALSDRLQKDEVRQFARLAIVQRVLAPTSDSGADIGPEIVDFN
jgi:hypothetical protein